MSDTGPILFYRATGKFGPFSNFYPCSFQDDQGIVYNCSEQYYMLRKLKEFDPGNREMFHRILMEGDPKQIKKYGQRIAHFSEEQWQEVRDAAMIDGLILKFSQNARLASLLLETGERVIAEASPTDLIWGIGLTTTDPRARDSANWRGTNALGRALMTVRARLRGR